MRMLPVYVMIDVSESMVGDTMRQIDEGLVKLSDTLKTIPEALESAKVSVIAFAGKPKVISPMVEVAHFYPPRLPIGGGTALGAALDLLMNRIAQDVATASSGRKGDWKPIVFLLTDGVPTDNPAPAIARWKKDFAKRANLIAISVGGRADLAGLREIADKVMILNDMADNAFAGLIEWVTQSITLHSQSVGIGPVTEGVNLSKDLPPELAEDDGVSTGAPDDRYVVIVGKCEKNELPYLLKFERAMIMKDRYEFRAAVPASNEYFAMSSGAGGMHEISGHQLMGGASCPQCGNGASLARCGKCNGVHCLDLGTLTAICPWCGSEGQYGVAEEGSDFSLTRGLG